MGFKGFVLDLSLLFLLNKATAEVNDDVVPKYRCDYSYIKQIDTYFKFYDIPATWQDARLRCHLEGGVLASPLNRQYHDSLLAFATKKQKEGNLEKKIFLGAHATFSRGDFYSVEGIPLNNLYFKWAKGKPSNQYNSLSCLTLDGNGKVSDEVCSNVHTYVCAKPAKDVNFSTVCGTADPAYTKSSVTGNCYKYHTVPRIFSDAVRTCKAEGGSLAIVNSEYESWFLKVLIVSEASEVNINIDKSSAFIGFHDWGQHGEWLTLQDQTLSEAGFAKWTSGSPNNGTSEGLYGGKFCGSLKQDGLLNDYRCDKVLPFICEKVPERLVNDCKKHRGN